MGKLFFILLAIAFTLSVNAQTLTPSVISTTGGFSSNTTGSLSFTVAEMTMVQTFSAGNHILTQGFQQPSERITGLLDLVQGEFGSLVIYPNPAVDNLWFGLQLPEAGKVQVILYDGIGHKISDAFSTNYENGKVVQQMNVTMYAAGTYFLTMYCVSAKDGSTHTTSRKFQIIH